MKLFLACIAFLPAFVAGSVLAAEDSGELLKVSPAADRPVGNEKDAAAAKGAAKDAEPAPAKPEPSPGSSAAPAENEAAGPSNEPVPEAIAPEPFPISRYATLWENSPFQIESIAPPQQSEGLAQRFALGGILRENGEPVIWVRERASQQSFKLERNVTNIMGLSLVEVQEDMTNQLAATATIRMGNEQGAIKFDAAAAGAGMVPGMAPPPPPMARPVAPFVNRSPQIAPQALMPGQIPGQVGVPAPQQQGIPAPGIAQPGVVPPVPGPGVAPNGQVQAPGAGQMPPPRVIRRRAIIPAAPSTP